MQDAERSFEAKLPQGFTICRKAVGVDTVEFEVRRGSVAYLELMYTAQPFGNDDANGDHIVAGERGGKVRRSPDGRVEILTVRFNGRDHFRESMTRTRKGEVGGVWYLIVDVPRELNVARTEVAEEIASSIHVR